MRERDWPSLEEIFPNLQPGSYALTSSDDPGYNCVAWAAGSTGARWQAILIRGYFWPVGAATDDSLGRWVQAVETLRFEVCDGAAAEPGWQKAAIDVSSEGLPRHVALQLAAGGWTSKLGKLEDVTNGALDVLEDDGPYDYGRAQTFLKRRRADNV